MSNAIRIARTGVVLLALAGSGFAPAAPKKAPANQPNWWISEFTWVKKTAKEPNAPDNDKPVFLSLDMMKQDLAAIQLNQEEPLFGKDEIKDLARPMCEALAQAKPNEDLLLLSTSRRSDSLLATRSAITARFFIKDGRLNLILHDARNAFYDRYLGTRVTPEFKYGSRTLAGAVEIDCAGAEKVRRDWLTFPVILQAPAPVSKAMAPAAMAPAAMAPAAAAPVVAPAAAPVAAPVAAPEFAPAAVPAPAAPLIKDKAYYEQQQLRLRTLKQLHDDNLISDEEYNAKRKELLGSL